MFLLGDSTPGFAIISSLSLMDIIHATFQSCISILIHHLPKLYNILPYADYGSEELADVLLTKPNIKYSLFGHVHSGDHNITKNANGTCLVNVSIKDENYKRTYDVFTFEI